MSRPGGPRLVDYYDADPSDAKPSLFRYRVCCYTAAILGDVLNARDIASDLQGVDRARVEQVVGMVAPGVLS